MQDQKLSLTLISIPTELLDEAGITENSVVEMYMDNGNIVIRKAEDVSRYVCDNDCQSCPVMYTECDDNCKECPCKDHCEDYIESEDN
ncbi:MAG: AbrB/MazE/SpoVT family DNA-binding domain-containing protein [Clostridia bacterium]|nr:AbrB/MazE/SpoVT family DNA-binding domain-containing protein [Clostridia bacterium]